MRPRSLLVLGWLALIGLLAPGAAGQVLQPGDIVVSDRGAGTVVRIDPDPPHTQTELESGLPSVRGILADGFGSVFLTESVSDLVLRLDPDTDVLGIVAGPNEFAVPEEIVFEPSGDLLVAGPWFQAVWRLDPVVGTPTIAYVDPNDPENDFTLGFPQGLALGPAGQTLYVSDTTTVAPAVYKIDLAPPPPDRTIEPVSVGQNFITPMDVALEPGGATLLVADRFAGAVFRVNLAQPYDANQMEVVTGLQAPVGLYVYPNGDFLVADFGAGEVHLYASSASPGVDPLETYSGGLVGPWRITVVGPLESRAEFLVADTDQAELYSLTPEPADPAAATRLPVVHEIGLETPSGIAVDTDGTVLLCDAGDPPSPEQALLRVNPATTPGGDAVVSAGGDLIDPNRVVVHRIGGEIVYFVADPGAGAILEVMPNGAQSVLEPPTGEQNYLVEPVALALDQDGLLVVLNRDVGVEASKPLLRVNPESGFQNPLPVDTALILDPIDLAIDANGDILLADGGDPEQAKAPFIFRFDGVHSFAQQKSYGSDLFHTLEGIALDVNRELLVTDSGDPGADPAIEPAVIRIDTTSGSASVVEIDEAESWLRPNGIALALSADPPVVADLDGDTIADGLDNCIDVFNPDQNDVNADGIGDACQPDDPDGDGWPADDDNCQEVHNAYQVDTNLDGIGNHCDADYNNDGLVGGPDFLLLTPAWGATFGSPRYDPDLDSNPADGIGGPEFILFSSQWGQPPGPGLPGCDGTTSPCPEEP